MEQEHRLAALSTTTLGSESESRTTITDGASLDDSTSGFSSRTTFKGLGSISGRAIYAIGKVQLKLAEALAIRYKLTITRARLSNTSHPDSSDDPVLLGIYRDLIDFSTPYFSTAVRIKAVVSLLDSIFEGRTQCLLAALALGEGYESIEGVLRLLVCYKYSRDKLWFVKFFHALINRCKSIIGNQQRYATY